MAATLTTGGDISTPLTALGAMAAKAERHGGQTRALREQVQSGS